MVAPVHGVDKTSFRLSNRFLGYSSYHAYFNMKSSPHFSVTPQTGMLPPHGSEGAPFTITFAPVEYGTIEVGYLVIATDDAQWNYEVRGRYPNDINLDQKSKVDSNVSGALNSLTIR